MHYLEDFDIPEYRPPFFAQQGDVNTLLSSLWPVPKLDFKKEKLVIPYADGSHTIGDFYPEDSNRHQTGDEGQWIAVFFHGLAGSSESDFLIRGVRVAAQMGIPALAMNHRNCGSALGLASSTYHSGKGEDASDVFDFVKAQWPQKKIIAISYSLGASMLLNLRTHRSGHTQPDLVVAINPPLDLKVSSVLLTEGSGRIYGQHFVRKLRRQIDSLIKLGKVDSKHCIPPKANLIDVDEIFTAPLSGFRSADHYYEVASSGEHLANIDQETLILASLDDPFIPYDRWLVKFIFSPQLRFHFVDHGGHVGFWNYKRRWSELFLENVFKKISRFDWS